MARVNPAWKSEMQSKLFQGLLIDEIISYRPAVQWLITEMYRIGMPYKLINLGAGVTKVTSNTEVCPKCGR